MNILDDMERHVEYSKANAQGHIFEYASELGYNMEIFVARYMESDFCNVEMDSEYSCYQNELDVPCMEVIMNEFSEKGINIARDESKTYRYCAYYVGFVYRYLQILSKMSSKELSRKIPFETMVLDYYLDHYEYPDAIKTICECEGINYCD